MWRFSIISDILRGTWAIEPRYALSLEPTLSMLLNKDASVHVPEREPLCILAMTEEGEQSIWDQAPKGSVAIVPLIGTMRKYGSLSSYGTEEIAAVLKEAAAHPNIDAIVLSVDSGGGTTDSVSPMLEAIEFSQRNGKPVVTHADLAASAAYWVASKTDMIFASNNISAEFGSIGVMISFADMRGLYEKDGVKFHTVYAPESTHKNLEFENLLKGDYELVQNNVLSPIAKAFQEDVRKNRKGINEGVQGILNGRMFYARDAVKNGLADKIGTLEMAVKQAKKLALSYSFTKKQ
jgi:protease IV